MVVARQDATSLNESRTHHDDFARGGESKTLVGGVKETGRMSPLLRLVWWAMRPVSTSRDDRHESAATVRARRRRGVDGDHVTRTGCRRDGAGRRISVGVGMGHFLLPIGRVRRHAENLLRARQAGRDVPGSQQPVVADCEEGPREDVEQDSADEFTGRDRARVLPPRAEDDRILGPGDEPRRRDRDAVRVAPEVVDELGWSPEGLLREDDPVLFLRIADDPPRLRLGEGERPGAPEFDPAGEELATKHLGQWGDGKQEVGVGDGDPLGAVGTEPASRNDGVEMGW